MKFFQSDGFTFIGIGIMCLCIMHGCATCTRALGDKNAGEIRAEAASKEGK